MRIIKRRHTAQPQQPPRINAGNALGAKVIEHISLNGHIRGLVASGNGTRGAGGTVASTHKGIGLRGSSTGARASIALDLSGKAKITLAFWLYWDAYADNDALAFEFGTPNYTAQNGILIDPNASGIGGLFLAGVGGAGSNLVAFPRPSAGAWHRITLAMDRTTGTTPSTAAWVDGIKQAVTTPLTATAVTGNFASATLFMLSRSGTSLFGTGNLQDITIYDGLLTDPEAVEDFRNPYQIFQGRSVLPYVQAPAGGAITGTFASTLSGVTMAASGAAINAGAFASTLTGCTMDAAGSVGSAPSGALASTLAGCTMGASGAIVVPGAFASTLGGVTMASAGTVNNRGAMASSLDGISMAAVGTVAPNATGTFASTLDGVSMAANGYNGIPPALPDFFLRLPRNPRHIQRRL